MLRVASFTGALDREVTEAIILVEAASEIPIYSALVAAGQIRAATAEKLEWWTDGHAARRTQINNGGSAYTGSTTDLVVDDASIFYPNSQAYSEATNEVMLVTAVNTGTNTITVVRGVGNIAGAPGSVANDVWLRQIGSAAGEGAHLQAARFGNKTAVVNYMQTFRHTVSLSGRLNAIGKLTEDERAYQRRKKFSEHIRDIENAILYGQPDEGTTDGDGNRVTTMGGLLQAITTNVDNVGGTMTLARWNQAVEPVFNYGSSRKLMFAGPTFLRTLHTLYEAKLQTRSGERATGLSVAQVLTPYGELDIIPHRQLVGGQAGMAIIVDPMDAQIRPLSDARGRPHLNENVQQPGQDSVADEWFAELSLEWGDQNKHSVIKGVTGPA